MCRRSLTRVGVKMRNNLISNQLRHFQSRCAGQELVGQSYPFRVGSKPFPDIFMATLVQAVRLALHYGETYLGVTDIFGEDVGVSPLGGVFTPPHPRFENRLNSPLLDERGIIGMAMGIAYAGGRPVAEIQFCDYGFNTIDLLKVAGRQAAGPAPGNYALANGRYDAKAARGFGAASITRTRSESWASPAGRLENRHAQQRA